MNSNNRYSISAPTSDIVVEIDLNSGPPRYAVTYKDTTILKPSKLGIELEGENNLTGSFNVLKTERDSVDEIWEPVWGSASEIRNSYNELHFQLEQSNQSERLLEFTFRVFNDGVGFRYTIPDQTDLTDFSIADERSEFRFANDFTAWWIPARKMGPRPCSWIDSYEKIYSETLLSEMPQSMTPITIEAADDIYLTLHEAALFDYAGMEIAPVDGESHTFKSELVALPNGSKVTGKVPHSSPWRTLTIGDSPGDLIESHLLKNLNKPNDFDDQSWINPGKYVGVWWEMHKGDSEWAYGPEVGATTENMKNYIDFAAEHGISYVLAEGWNVGWGNHTNEVDFTRAHDRFDLNEVLEYCADRDVQFLAHVETYGDVENFESNLEEIFDFYKEHGIPGLKTGYADDIEDHHRHDQWMVNHYEKVASVAAEHCLMVDIHEPIKPTGDIRTYPNIMSREGVRGMEINAAEHLGNGNPPEHTVTIPFTRMIAGPVDYTPGIFEIEWDPSNNNTRVHTTRARQLALYPILLSGLQMVADLPKHYDDQPEFAFIEQVPVDWDETHVVNASIGEYVTIARRHGDEWYVGTGTDDQARTLDIPLDFLDCGTYVAEIYSDGADADINNNPTSVAINKQLVDASTIIAAPMVAGGGQAIRLRPATTDEENSIPTYARDELPSHNTTPTT